MLGKCFYFFVIQKFKTYHLATQFYHKSNSLSLRDPIKNQLLRAILSIVLNLAEGSAKSSYKERRKFYEISLEINLIDFLNVVLRNEEILFTKMHQAF